jgi:hypothetical protein
LNYRSDLVVNVGNEREGFIGFLLDTGDVIEGVQESDTGISFATFLSVYLMKNNFIVF